MPEFNWDTDTLAEDFEIFQQHMEIYFQLKQTIIDHQVPSILLATGKEGTRRYNAWNLAKDKKKDPTVVFKKFRDQLAPPENPRINRLKLSKFEMAPSESVDMFVNRCQLLARRCAFGSVAERNGRIIELIIASTHLPELRKELLKHDMNLTLKQAVDIARTQEATELYTREIETHRKKSSVEYQCDEIRQHKETSACKNCGESHQRERSHCPARENTCSDCGKIGHWTRKCITSRYRQQKTGKINQTTDPANTIVVGSIAVHKSLCKNCGRDHIRSRSDCPAHKDTCGACGKTGHWTRLCLTTRYRQQGRQTHRPSNQASKRLKQQKRQNCRPAHQVPDATRYSPIFSPPRQKVRAQNQNGMRTQTPADQEKESPPFQPQMPHQSPAPSPAVIQTSPDIDDSMMRMMMIDTRTPTPTRPNNRTYCRPEELEFDYLIFD